MSYQYESIVTVAAGGIGILGGMMKRIEGGWGLSHIGISAAEEIVGEHLLVGGAVAVEIVSEGEGQRVIGQQGVSLIGGLQIVEPLSHPLTIGTRQEE